MSRKYILTAFGYAILGMLLGIHMAASKSFGQQVTHAHILLVGFVLSFCYGLCHKLWLDESCSKLAVAQFYVHQAGAFVLSLGLFLFYGQFGLQKVVDPILALASLTVLSGVILMKIEFVRCTKG